MAVELRPGQWQDDGHVCPLPWPKDPDIPEGHACECGRRWVYQPARWDPLITLEELRLRQEAGDFLRGIIPSFPSKAQLPAGLAGRFAEDDEPGEPAAAVIVPMPAARVASPEMPPPPAA